MSAPERKTGYTPSTWKMLDADLSGDAALLLLRLRRLSDEAESDGYLAPRDIAALTAFHRLPKARVTRCLAELVQLGLLDKAGETYRDVEFLSVCRSADERRERREQWKLSTKTYRDKPKSAAESVTVSAAESAHSPSESLSLALAPSPVALPNGNKPADPTPSGVDTSMVVKTWEVLVGREASQDETDHVRWLLAMYDRLGANGIVGVITRVHTREVGRGQSHPLRYFDGAIRQANDEAKPSRLVSIVRGIDEPA
jgi:hypothetical protein